MKPKLLIVTGNSMKFRELSAALGEYFECEQKEWNEPEIQGSPEEIIRHKAAQAYELFKQPVLVDDVSVHFDALGGFPGPYMKYFWDHMTPDEIGNKFAGSRMKTICWLELYRNPEDNILVQGIAEGTVVKPNESDHKGKYFDLFMQVDGTDKPMIELSVAEKNEISHRGRALKNLVEALKNEGITY